MFSVLFPNVTSGDVILWIWLIIIIILLIREINCWYWKINTQISIQEDILSALIDIVNEIKTLNSNNTKSIENYPIDKINNEKESFLKSEPTENIEKWNS